MKKLFLLLALVLCFGVFALAQEQPSQDQGGDTAAAPAGQPGAQAQSAHQTSAQGAHAKTVKGCLSGPDASGNYTLTTPRKTVTVAPSDQLTAHVGHEVRLKGSMGADNVLTVASVKHISSTCPASQAGAASSAPPKGQGGNVPK